MLRFCLPLLSAVVLGAVLLLTPAVAGDDVAARKVAATVQRAPMPPEVWKDYTYEADGFGISAPVEPVFTHQVRPTPNGSAARNSYEVNLNVGSLALSVSLLPANDKRTPQQVFDETKATAAAGMNAQVTASVPIAPGAYPTVQFDLTAPQVHSRIRYVLVGRKLFQLGGLAPTGQPLPAETGRWFDSFHVIDKK